eukprot:PhF_6_TR4385/c0_g1_i1/m.5917
MDAGIAVVVYSIVTIVLSAIAARSGWCRHNYLWYVYVCLLSFAGYHLIQHSSSSPFTLGLYLTSLVAHYVVSRSEPGAMMCPPTSSSEAKKYPPKCSQCDRHVEGFDHHCGWIANDVGKRNRNIFRLFLLAHTMLCVVMATESISDLSEIYRKNKLYESKFTVGSERGVTSSNWIVLQYLAQKHLSHVMVVFLGTAVGFCLSIFTTIQYLK